MSGKILEIENLTVSFDGFKAINNLSFNMDVGELRVVIGPNGAGKTTFMDVITGKTKPSTGQVLFKGRNLRAYSEHQIARMGIGRKFQTPRVYLKLTPRENLELSCAREKNVFAALFGRSSAGERRTVSGLLETIGLSLKADIPAELLSHGEKQRLEIGMLVAQSPDLLLVDEPVAGLTDEETEQVGELLLALAESHSIMVIEHDMEFVRQIARKVTVLHQGSVLCEGSMDEVQNDPRVIEVYLGQQSSISAQQMKILHIVAAMAWADGDLAPEEETLLLQHLSYQFAHDRDEQEQLQHELRDYLLQSASIEDLVPQLQTVAEREMVLKLAYQVIRASSRAGNGALVNESESSAYQTLLTLLDLPGEAVSRLEAEASH
ncbi:urea ABC transporter ATP-binding protein UrtD [Leptolyngbya sp. 'hensonii']|uniref:urea ABC transporter ATP-binding protein UrtD n=1 Tax=Leptolyngbya sp. 'hensonii' TaxID=1922337 RepID=UPI0009501A6B|nr:urea ABC transporter ATP-binding protein UrtD [Leptolyngbya sp. 'hensonii']OLP15672.1 urea ABC transporter ATP-binding protein UrtD [Leptolyngbya sp. 'hensonii']